MNMLFDPEETSAPEDVQPRKKGRKKPAVVEAPAVEPEIPMPPRVVAVARVLGQIDDIECVCGTSRWDIMDEWRGEWVVECWACYRSRRMPAVPGHLKPRSQFTLRDGRFKGLTIDEAAAQPRGIDTIRHYATNHKDEEVRAAARKFLDGLAVVP